MTVTAVDSVASFHPTIDRSPHHFSFVDALRGFAILAVVLTHCGQEVPGISPVVYAFTDACSYGVELFFVVSAFTLFWSLKNRGGVDRDPIKAFFVRRLFRIAPLFWGGVLFYSLHRPANALQFAPYGSGWKHITATLLLVHGWYPTTVNSVVPGGWSIAAEAMFYLCLPLLHRYMKSLRAAVWFTLITAFFSGLMPAIRDHVLMHFFPESQRDLVGLFLFWSFPSQLPVFGFGLVLYFVLMQQMARASTLIEHKTQWSILLLAIAAFLMFRRVPDHVLYAAAFALIAIGLAMHPIRLLVNRITRGIGLVSYSVYIWHFAILYAVAPWLLQTVHLHALPQLVVTYLVVLSLSLAAACVSYMLIEKPSQQLGKRLIQRLGWGGVGLRS
jgi:peptidoglycan/LPS O-acetylase OafA/YrhL